MNTTFFLVAPDLLHAFITPETYSNTNLSKYCQTVQVTTIRAGFICALVVLWFYGLIFLNHLFVGVEKLRSLDKEGFSFIATVFVGLIYSGE